MQSRDEKPLSELYDASVDAYDKLYMEIQTKKYLLIKNLYKPKSVLDVGIGTGYICITGILYIIGIDISFKSLQKARERCEYADLILASADNIPIKGGFDLVLMISTIHHLKDPCKIVKEISQLGRHIAISIMKKYDAIESLDECLTNMGFKKMDLWDDVLYTR